MRTQIKSGISAFLLAVPVLALAQAGPAMISDVDGPASPDGGGGFSCGDGVVLLDQAPNQSNGIFNDGDCSLCGSGAQSVAENFTLAEDQSITSLTWWGGYFPGNQFPNPAEEFTITFHQDAAGLPGTDIDVQTVTPELTVTGVVLFGVNELMYTAEIAPVALSAGSYWVEITTNSTGTSDSSFWEIGNADTIGNGVDGTAFATQVPGTTWNFTAAQDFALGMCGTAAPSEEARFLVTKDFNDDNEGSVEVTLSCNTGIPLEQTTTIEEGDPVNFVIGDFEQGALNCTVTETPIDGYDTFYTTDPLIVGVEGQNTEGCTWENLQGFQFACAITNELQASTVDVTKEWIDENPDFDAINIAEAYWSCSNEAFGPDSGYLNFVGNPGNDSFMVYPDWESGTVCNVVEVLLPDGGVESDDSDCGGITLFPGDDSACTIVNTRLYEGIPTLSQYGLAVLALMMLGVGFVAVRRFV